MKIKNIAPIIIITIMMKINLSGAWFIVEIGDLWGQESWLPVAKKYLKNLVACKKKDLKIWFPAGKDLNS